MTLNYRPGVVGVIKNKDNLVLVGERSDVPGQWQFPQGGLQEGESETEGIRREMREEIGTDDFSILKISESRTTYLFPNKLSYPEDKVPYDGQAHRWFLLELNHDYNDESGRYIPPTKDIDDEFINFKWVPADEVYKNIVSWKKDSYKQGLLLLGFKID